MKERANLLVVDPDPELGRRVGEALPEDRVVIPAADLRTADDILQRAPVAAVLVAQRWPGQTGLAWLEQAADRLGEAARLLLTDLADLPDVHPACLAGQVDAYLVRPVDAARLQEALAEAEARRARGDWI
jgi:DNA-binding NtrC family response regulator